jgi:hypothetical protein
MVLSVGPRQRTARLRAERASIGVAGGQRRHADRPSPGDRIRHIRFMLHTSQHKRKTTMTQAATIHLAQWRNDSLSLKLFRNHLSRYKFYTSWYQTQRQARLSRGERCILVSVARSDSRDIASLSTRLLFRLSHNGTLRCHYPCLDIGNIMCRSQTIPRVGCRETSLDP